MVGSFGSVDILLQINPSQHSLSLSQNSLNSLHCVIVGSAVVGDSVGSGVGSGVGSSVGFEVVGVSVGFGVASGSVGASVVGLSLGSAVVGADVVVPGRFPQGSGMLSIM